MSVTSDQRLTPADVAEFEAFFAATRRATLLAVLPLVRDLGEAEDVLQVAYERAVAHWRTVRGYDNPGAWVRRVAHNEAVSWLRRARRQLVDYLPELTDLAQAHHDTYDHDAPDLLLALRRLPHRDRVVLTLHYVWGYSIDEVATELGTGTHTVKSRLALARRRLGELVEADTQARTDVAQARIQAVAP